MYIYIHVSGITFYSNIVESINVVGLNYKTMTIK